jgi:hypothetical protein
MSANITLLALFSLLFLDSKFVNNFKRNSENVNILNVQYSATACTTNSFLCHLDTVFGDNNKQGTVAFLFTRSEPMQFLRVVYVKELSV